MVAAALLMWLSGATLAAERAPRIVREPVLDLRYEIARAKFDTLPSEILAQCSTQTKDNVRDHLWIFAYARDATRSYYVVNGYSVRLHPEPPDFPKYESYDYGDVLLVEGSQCRRLGGVKEAFNDGPYDELPQRVLQQLAIDLAARLARGFGGTDRLRTELHNQHVDFDRLTPELREAFKAYATP